MMEKGRCIKEKALLLLVAAFVVLLLPACGKKTTYTVSEKELIAHGTTAEEFAQNTENWTGREPEKKYGNVYADSEGNLCFDLTNEELENWKSHYQQRWEIAENQTKEAGISIQYDDEKQVLTIEYTEMPIDAKQEEEEVADFAGSMAWLGFFTDPNREIKLTTIVKDGEGNTLGQVEWPETTGFFSGMEK